MTNDGDDEDNHKSPVNQRCKIMALFQDWLREPVPDLLRKHDATINPVTLCWAVFITI